MPSTIIAFSKVFTSKLGSHSNIKKKANTTGHLTTIIDNIYIAFTSCTRMRTNKLAKNFLFKSIV